MHYAVTRIPNGRSLEISRKQWSSRNRGALSSVLLSEPPLGRFRHEFNAHAQGIWSRVHGRRHTRAVNGRALKEVTFVCYVVATLLRCYVCRVRPYTWKMIFQSQMIYVRSVDKWRLWNAWRNFKCSLQVQRWRSCSTGVFKNCFNSVTLLHCSGRAFEWIWRCEEWCVIVGFSSVCCFVQIGKCLCSLGVQPTFRGRLVRSCSVDKVFTQ